MTILDIKKFPDPILQQISQPIAKVDDEIRKIMDDMMETMYSNNGIGLAAVQVGILKRILVMDLSYGSNRYEITDSNNVSGKIFIANPKIIRKSKNLVSYEEGCLSFPNINSNIKRPDKIEIEYLDYNNEKQILKAENSILAVCVQHEIDHLDGIRFIDHLSKLKKSFLLKKIKKNDKL